MQSRAAHLAAAIAFMTASAGWPAHAARDLSVALSSTVVAVTTQFTGSELLLFGSKEGSGDVVVVVRGPQQDPVVRRKDRVGGIWVNNAEVTFDRVPTFYAVAANRPLGDILDPRVRKSHQIGIEYIELSPKPGTKLQLPATAIEEFRKAFFRNKQREGLYTIGQGAVNFLTGQLFVTRIQFPANVTVGTFGVDVHLVRDRQIWTTETRLINVRKFGLEAEVYGFAHRQSLAYGILAVLIAVVAGWLANAAFRKK